MTVNNSFYDRLMLVKDYLKIKSERSFAPIIGITPENLSSYKRGSIPSIKILIKILRNVEGLSADWLLFGKGQMILSQEDETTVNEEQRGYIAGGITISSDEYKEMKRQISDLIATNRNLSEVVREKNSAGSA